MGIAINSKVPAGFAVNGKNVGGLAVNGDVVWRKTSMKDYCLTFDSNTAFTLAVTVPNWDGTLYTSTDAETWEEWDGASVSSSSNGLLYMAGVGNTKIGGSDTDNAFTFTDASGMSCVGNIETLLDWETVAGGGSPTMATSCYRYMFYRCTSLTTAPSLPATTLTSYCYNYMFSSCTSLTTAPSLPATMLAAYCYRSMFSSCTSLTTPPSLPATTLASYCYNSMFSSCTSLTTAPSLPVTTLRTYCYSFMFSSCTSLTTPPSLPATTLAYGCYYRMFFGCTSLKISKSYSASYYKYSWRIPTSGTITSESDIWNSGMLYNTGGTLTDSIMGGTTVNINTTYYTNNEPVGDMVATAYSAEVATFGITSADTEEENIEILNELGVTV